MKNMAKYCIISFLTAVACFKQISTNHFYPKILHEKCFLKDLECLKSQAQNSVSFFTNGIPELGIENLSKMSIDSLEIEKDGLIYELTNVTVNGLKDAIIDQFWIDTLVKYIHITFHTNLVLDSKYKVDGYLFSYPVHGDGRANIVKKHIVMELLLFFDIKKNHDGKDIINLKTYRYGFDQQIGTVYTFENLFDGDKVRSDIAHGLVNKNWRTVSTNFSKFLYDKINAKIFNAVKAYLSSFPLEDIAILK